MGHGSRKMSPQQISMMKYISKKVLLNISLVGSVPEQEGYISVFFFIYIFFLKVSLDYSTYI